MSASVTPDARAALEAAGFSRRTFLKGSGVLIVSFGAAHVSGTLAAVPAQGFNGQGSDRLDSWIADRRGQRVTAYTGKAELGQGLYTAQTQLVAEELCVPFSRVTLSSATPASRRTREPRPAASRIRPTSIRANLALAARHGTRGALPLASARLGVPVDQLTVADGVVSVKADPSRKSRATESWSEARVQPPAQSRGASGSLRASGPSRARRCGVSICLRW